MGKRLYKRSCRVLIGGGSILNVANIEGEGLRIAFNFVRNTMSEPDQGTIQIYNLSETTRKLLDTVFQELKDLRQQVVNDTISPPLAKGAALKALEEGFKVLVFAGYGQAPTIIFQGSIADLQHRRDAKNWVTEMKVGDSIIAYRESYISESFGPGATIENFRKVLQIAMGLTESPDAAAVVSAVAPQAVVTQAANGIVAVGKPSDMLDEVAAMYGLQWWHRDGLIYYVPQGAVTLDFSIVLRENVNLILSPQVNSQGDVSGIGLLNPDLYPGRGMFVVKQPKPLDYKFNPITGLRGEHVGASNGLRCESVNHLGDTHGQAWYSEFDARVATSAVAAPTLEFTDAELFALEPELFAPG